MISQNKFVAGFRDLARKNLVISIAGESGLGKTSLALYLIGNLLPIENASCVWVQASELFPKKRMISMFQKNTSVLDYLNNNLFIVPKSSCKDQSSLNDTIKLFFSRETVLPPNIKYVVIDNISHHLRYRLEQIQDINGRILCVNDFFYSFLQPFLSYCATNNVIPILIHEMSFNPGLNQNKMFFYKLFERIESLFLSLRKSYRSNGLNVITITHKKCEWNLKYKLSTDGFDFYF